MCSELNYKILGKLMHNFDVFRKNMSKNYEIKIRFTKSRLFSMVETHG